MLRACFTLHVHLSLFPLSKAWYRVLLSGQECLNRNALNVNSDLVL